MSTLWLNVTAWFKTMWIYIKKYWSFIIFAIFFAATIFVYRNKEKAINDLIKKQEEISKTHRQELAQIQQIRDDEIKRRTEIEANYQATIDKINKDHAEAIGKLTAAKEDELRKIISEAKDDPNVMASRINSLFGIEIYKP